MDVAKVFRKIVKGKPIWERALWQVDHPSQSSDDTVAESFIEVQPNEARETLDKMMVDSVDKQKLEQLLNMAANIEQLNEQMTHFGKRITALEQAQQLQQANAGGSASSEYSGGTIEQLEARIAAVENATGGKPATSPWTRRQQENVEGKDRKGDHKGDDHKNKGDQKGKGDWQPKGGQKTYGQC